MIEFENNIVSIYGNNGKLWLDSLPSLLKVISDKHQLTDLEPVENLSYNYVAKGFQGEKPIVIKLGYDIHAIFREASIIELYDGNNLCPKLYAKGEGYIILEQAILGSSLKEYAFDREIESIEIFCSLLKNISQQPLSVNHQLPLVKDWLYAIERSIDIPSKYLIKARTLAKELLSTTQKEVLLHGDLHHDNILQHHNRWIMIDPKGVVGDICFEVCAFLRNPAPELLKEPNPKDIINRRIQYCAKLLDTSEERLRHWFYVESVLSWAWQLEDHLDISESKKLVDVTFHL